MKLEITVRTGDRGRPKTVKLGAIASFLLMAIIRVSGR